MVTVQSLLLRAQATLNTVTDTPLLDAEILLAAVLQKPRSFSIRGQKRW